MEELVASLRQQLEKKTAEKAELEAYNVKKTRETWLMREKFEKELKQCQDQLSVVRASLLLVHRQQQLKHQVVLEQPAPGSADGAAATAAVPETAPDVPGDEPVLGSPRKRKQLPDQVNRAVNRGADGTTAAASPKPSAGTAEMQDQHTAAAVAAETSGALAAVDSVTHSIGAASVAASVVQPESAESDQQTVRDSSNIASKNQEQFPHLLLDVSTQLLSAAGKLQQLVEQLTHTEPAAAADLSVLQYQLITAYGQLNNTTAQKPPPAPSGSHSKPVMADGVCSSIVTSEHPLAEPAEPAPAQLSAGAARAAENVIAASSAQSAESGVAREAEAGKVAAAVQQLYGDSDVGSLADTAAAAKLFSGAATQLQAAQLAWFYLDGSRVRGPHDPAAMIRWHCSSYLEAALPVAAAVQAMDGSSTPPLAAFRPLRQLLLEVQQGGWYCPFVADQQQQQQQQQQQGCGPAAERGGSSSSHFPSAPVALGLQQIAARLRDVARIDGPLTQKPAAAATPGISHTESAAASGQVMPRSAAAPTKTADGNTSGEKPGSSSSSSGDGVNSSSTAISSTKEQQIPSSKPSGIGNSSAGIGSASSGIAAWILPRDGSSNAANGSSSITIPWEWWVMDGDVSASSAASSSSSSRDSSSSGATDGGSGNDVTDSGSKAASSGPTRQLPVSTLPGNWPVLSQQTKPGDAVAASAWQQHVVNVTAVAAGSEWLIPAAQQAAHGGQCS